MIASRSTAADTARRNTGLLNQPAFTFPTGGSLPCPPSFWLKKMH